MVRLGFSLQPRYDRPLQQVIGLLQEAGFSAVSPVYAPELPLEDLANAAARRGMTIQSLHAPHGGLTALWNSRDPMSPEIRKRVTDCIDSCARFQIPIAVVHCWQGLQYTFPGEPLDYSVFDAIVERAVQQNVSIAFENLEGEEYLEALMTRYRELPNIGFCWDSGHDHCYPHRTDFLERYGHRLIMTHINDNLGLRDPNGVPSGMDDLHFLPYDGTISWETAISRLKHLPRQEILNFEIKKRSKSSVPGDLLYDSLSAEDFFRLAGQRAEKIAELYRRITGED